MFDVCENCNGPCEECIVTHNFQEAETYRKALEALAEFVKDSEPVVCLFCKNWMKNVTIEGGKKGCNGNCKVPEYTAKNIRDRFIAYVQNKG